MAYNTETHKSIQLIVFKDKYNEFMNILLQKDKKIVEVSNDVIDCYIEANKKILN